MTEEMNLAVFDPIKALTVKMQEEDAALEIDHTTPEGEKELRAYVRTVRGYRTGLEKIRVRAKADSLEYGKSVDKLAKELKAPFDTVIDARMKPLDEIEDAKRAAAEAIVEAERVAKEKAEADRLANLELREAKIAEVEAKIKAAEDAANAEQAEAGRIVREERIAKEAAATATKLAEANAAKQAEALRKSIQDNADRRERIRLEEIESKAAVVRMDAEVERKRVADVNHRTKVERGIQSALYDVLEESCETTDEAVDSVFSAIKGGDIPHITINY